MRSLLRQEGPNAAAAHSTSEASPIAVKSFSLCVLMTHATSLRASLLQLPKPGQGNRMAQATVAVVSQVAAFQGLSEKVQLARCVDCELGVRAHTMKDHKKHVLIPAVFVLIRIEVLGPCHARPFEILQARLGAGHVGLAPHVLSLAQRVEATDHRQQGAVLRQIVRREAGPELHHLVLGGVETPQLLLVMAPWLQGIHVSKDWNVGDRVQHVGECGVLTWRQCGQAGQSKAM